MVIRSLAFEEIVRSFVYVLLHFGMAVAAADTNFKSETVGERNGRTCRESGTPEFPRRTVQSRTAVLHVVVADLPVSAEVEPTEAAVAPEPPARLDAPRRDAEEIAASITPLHVVARCGQRPALFEEIFYFEVRDERVTFEVGHDAGPIQQVGFDSQQRTELPFLPNRRNRRRFGLCDDSLPRRFRLGGGLLRNRFPDGLRGCGLFYRNRKA